VDELAPGDTLTKLQGNVARAAAELQRRNAIRLGLVAAVVAAIVGGAAGAIIHG
jgi:hypothetical protein